LAAGRLTVLQPLLGDAVVLDVEGVEGAEAVDPPAGIALV